MEKPKPRRSLSGKISAVFSSKKSANKVDPLAADEMLRKAEEEQKRAQAELAKDLVLSAMDEALIEAQRLDARDKASKVISRSFKSSQELKLVKKNKALSLKLLMGSAGLILLLAMLYPLLEGLMKGK